MVRHIGLLECTWNVFYWKLLGVVVNIGGKFYENVLENVNQQTKAGIYRNLYVLQMIIP